MPVGMGLLLGLHDGFMPQDTAESMAITCIQRSARLPVMTCPSRCDISIIVPKRLPLICMRGVGHLIVIDMLAVECYRALDSR